MKYLFLTSILVLSIINHFKIKKIMNKQEQFDALLGRLDAATTGIANNLKALADNIQSGTVTQESLDQLNTDISKLEAMGTKSDTEVANPVETDVNAGSDTTDTDTTEEDI